MTAGVAVETMRRRHLRAVQRIDRAVYPRPWSTAMYLDELSRPYNRLYLVARAAAGGEVSEAAGGAAGGTAAAGGAGARRATGRAAPVLGCVGLLAVAGEGHITSVAVSPDAQGRRVGAALMLALHRAVRAGRTPDGRPVGEQVAAVEATTLEVRVSNHRAQRLYAWFGYAPVGSRAGYYRGGRGASRAGTAARAPEDALVMWCHDMTAAAHGERLDEIAAALAAPARRVAARPAAARP